MSEKKSGPYKWGKSIKDEDVLIGPNAVVVELSPIMDALNAAYAEGLKARPSTGDGLREALEQIAKKEYECDASHCLCCSCEAHQIAKDAVAKADQSESERK